MAMKPHQPGAFVLFAGPVAWFIELSVGYALASGPCFPGDRRLPQPAAQWSWTQPALYVLAVAAVLIAAYAFSVSLGVLRQQAASAHQVAAAGDRLKFSALWGATLGGGFCVATLLTGVGLILLPRCGG
jgi:hypothetical protein